MNQTLQGHDRDTARAYVRSEHWHDMVHAVTIFVIGILEKHREDTSCFLAQNTYRVPNTPRP